MQLTEWKHILMIGSKIKIVKSLFWAPFKYILLFLNQFAKKIHCLNSKSGKITEVFTLIKVKNSKSADKSLLFIKNACKQAKNTATVYINGSYCDLTTPASAYRLHPGVMLFSQHYERLRASL